MYGVQVPQGSFAGLRKTTAIPKDFTRVVPKPIIVVVKINGHPAQALLDSGSLGDFMSTTLADQLKVQRDTLAKPVLATSCTGLSFKSELWYKSQL